MSAARRKGTAAETATVNYVRTRGWPYAERRALSGANDRGDIAGIPDVVIEVKAAKAITLAAWLDELTQEIDNDGADIGWLVIKRRGCTDPADWYWLTTGTIATQLMREAGR